MQGKYQVREMKTQVTGYQKIVILYSHVLVHHGIRQHKHIRKGTENLSTPSPFVPSPVLKHCLEKPDLGNTHLSDESRPG